MAHTESGDGMKYMDLFKSIIDQDQNEIVICNMEHEILYMNPAAIVNYAKWGGEKLIGHNLMDCHNPESRDKIKKVLAWFAESADHNIVHTYYSEKHNEDVYMVALRAGGELIGYYEKHENRDRDDLELYDLR